MLQYKYDKVTSIDEGIKRLLEIRDAEIPELKYLRMPEGEYTDVLLLRGERIPLLHRRYEPRINGMKNYGAAAPDENCQLNTISFIGNDVSLDALIYAELDLAEYILRSPIVKVTAFINGGAANLLVKTEAGSVAGLELGATMAPGTVPQVNHRIITRHGMATDRTVNNVAEQSGVYLFQNSDSRPFTFDDGEYYLYGLSVEDSIRATYSFAVVQSKVDKNELIEQDKHLRDLLAAVHKSAELGAPVMVSEVIR